MYSFKFTLCKCYKFTKSFIDKAVPKTDPTVPNPMMKVFLTTTQTLRSGYLISKSMTQGMIMDKDAVVTEPKRATILSSWWTPAAKPTRIFFSELKIKQFQNFRILNVFSSLTKDVGNIPIVFYLWGCCQHLWSDCAHLEFELNTKLWFSRLTWDDDYGVTHGILC